MSCLHQSFSSIFAATEEAQLALLLQATEASNSLEATMTTGHG